MYTYIINAFGVTKLSRVYELPNPVRINTTPLPNLKLYLQTIKISIQTQPSSSSSSGDFDFDFGFSLQCDRSYDLERGAGKRIPKTSLYRAESVLSKEVNLS